MANFKFADGLPSQLKESVLKYHYNREGYKFDTSLVSSYNVCPLCGTIGLLKEEKAEDESSEGGLEVSWAVENCTMCQTISYRYPEMFIWVRNVIAAQQFQNSKEATFRNESTSKEKPIVKERTEEEEASADFESEQIN